MTAQHDPDYAGVFEAPRVPRPSEMSPINRMLDAADQITARTLAVEEIRELAKYWSDGGREPGHPAIRQAGNRLLAILEKHGC